MLDSRPAKAIALVTLCVAILGVFSFFTYLRSFSTKGIDFEAFYCGAQAARTGHDPYLFEPLHSCEHAVYFKSADDNLIVPDPLPGYAILAFTPLSAMPFGIAYALWSLFLAACIAATIPALVRLTGCTPLVATLTVVLIDAIVSLTIGQLVPVCVLFTTWGALCVRRERYWAACCCLALSMLQPQCGFVALMSLAVFEARSRVAVASALAALATASVLFLGLAANVEYVRDVLPAHAAAELYNIEQFALAPMLFELGARPQTALLIGTLSFFAMAVFGACVAQRLAARYGDRAFLVVVPCAFVLLGGTYLHIQSLAFALPAALLMRRYRPTTDGRFDAMLVMLCVPWQWLVLTMYMIPLAAVMSGILAWRLWERNIRALAIGIGSVAAAGLSMSLLFIYAYVPGPKHFSATAASHDLAENTWVLLERVYASTGAGFPTYCARSLSIVALAYLIFVLAKEGRVGRIGERFSPKCESAELASRP